MKRRKKLKFPSNRTEKYRQAEFKKRKRKRFLKKQNIKPSSSSSDSEPNNDNDIDERMSSSDNEVQVDLNDATQRRNPVIEAYVRNIEREPSFNDPENNNLSPENVGNISPDEFEDAIATTLAENDFEREYGSAPNAIQIEGINVSANRPLPPRVLNLLTDPILQTNQEQEPHEEAIQYALNNLEFEFPQIFRQYIESDENVSGDERNEDNNFYHTQTEHSSSNDEDDANNPRTFQESLGKSNLTLNEQVVFFLDSEGVSNTVIDGLLPIISKFTGEKVRLAKNIKRNFIKPSIYKSYVIQDKLNQSKALDMTIPTTKPFTYREYPTAKYEIIESCSFANPIYLYNLVTRLHKNFTNCQFDKECIISSDGISLFNSSSSKFSMFNIIFPFCKRSYPLLIRCNFSKKKCDRTSKSRFYQLIIRLLIKQGFKIKKYIGDMLEKYDLKGMASPNSSFPCDHCDVHAEWNKSANVSYHKVCKRQYDAGTAKNRTHQSVMDTKLLLNQLHDEPTINKDFIIKHKGDVRQSVFTEIEGFDIVNDCPMDVFHHIALGSGRKALIEVLDYDTSRANKFGQLKLATVFEEYYQKRKTVCNYQRGFRSIFDNFNYFKGREWMNLVHNYYLDIYHMTQKHEHDLSAKSRDMSKMLIFYFIISRYLCLPDCEDELINNETVKTDIKHIIQHYQRWFEFVCHPEKTGIKDHQLMVHSIESRDRHGDHTKFR